MAGVPTHGPTIPTAVRVLQVLTEPHLVVRHRSALDGGRGLHRRRVRRALVDRLPDDVDAILVASDLQGRAAFDEPGLAGQLLGVALAAAVAALAGDGVVPHAERLGVFLCGDLWADPDSAKLGGTGDVSAVWRAFARCARWVVGVLGNHDELGGSATEAAALRAAPGIHVLDPDARTFERVDIGGVTVAGISGIEGNPHKWLRRSDADLETAARAALATRPPVLLTHQHPAIAGAAQPGSRGLATALGEGAPCLAFFGHKRVDEPVVTLSNGTQLVSVEHAAILLTRAE